MIFISADMIAFCGKTKRIRRNKMDTGEGKFEMFEGKKMFKKIQAKYPFAPKHLGNTFKLGETVRIKESLFEIENVGQHRLRLKLLSQR
jgi:hypothetical protein